MDYSKFVDLINKGEIPNVDFKLHCDAFASSRISPNAELAKDICAMANNGNIASYIIVGVSDNKRKYKSVTNSNLTDDNLQVFCKNAISPPPKVKLERKNWKDSGSRYRDTDFVIIQIGPQKRQAFRLNQNFIAYEEKICYRINDVWIRRGATSDLATPEEIYNLLSGKPPIADPESVMLKKEQVVFQRLPVNQKMLAVDGWMRAFLISKLKYNKVRIVDWSRYPKSRGETKTVIYQIFEKFIILINVFSCMETLSKSQLEDPAISIFMGYRFVEKKDIPSPILTKIGDEKIAIRRLTIIPVLANVPIKRIQSGVKNGHWTGVHPHIYITSFYSRDSSQNNDLYPSSAELLILSNIDSAAYLEEKIISAMKDIEQCSNTIITP